MCLGCVVGKERGKHVFYLGVVLVHKQDRAPKVFAAILAYADAISPPVFHACYVAVAKDGAGQKRRVAGVVGEGVAECVEKLGFRPAYRA